MSIKEMREIKRKDISYDIRLKNALKIRDYTDAAKKATKTKQSVEIFHNTDYRKAGDKIGVTVYYPDMENPTHFLTGIFSTEMSERQFTKEVQKLEKEVLRKAGVK